MLPFHGVHFAQLSAFERRCLRCVRLLITLNNALMSLSLSFCLVAAMASALRVPHTNRWWI